MKNSFACTLIALVVSSLLALNLQAQENTPGNSASPPADPRDRAERPSPQSRTGASGWVFVDGELLPPPYEITETATGVAISGHPVVIEHFPPRGGPGGPGGWGGPGGRRERGERGPRQFGPGGNPGFGRGPSLAGWVTRRLEMGSIFVAFTNQPALSLEPGEQVTELFEVLKSKGQNLEEFTAFQDSLSSEAEKQLCTKWLTKEWLANFTPPEDFFKQMEEILTARKVSRAASKAEWAAIRRFNALSYPMVTLGMVVSVLTLGHLLMSAPRRGGAQGEPALQTGLVKDTVISLILVFALSALDLAWTLLASQANAMVELNPLGNTVIRDPQSLVAMKSGLTLLSCGLLFALRRHSFARLASWWLCLICTVLAFRWLMFTSMYAG